ncbi:PepSY domain-containing protein [Streptomyces sp. NPDC058401]|uniref:PepSY domain-containing protein n=1 Tax=Streptomyces sp. NPDC058401 TaxID=3346480 RepID=UPI00365644BE
MTQSSPQPPEFPPAAVPGEGGGEVVGNGDPAGKAAGPRGARIARFTRFAREGRGRWVALGLVVVASAGAGAAAVAVTDHGYDVRRTRAERVWDRFDVEREGGGEMTAPLPVRPGKPGEPGKPGLRGQKGEGGVFPPDGQGRPALPDGEEGFGVDGPGRAPVPLPALPAAQALEKAEAAVPGGKAEALRVIAQEGGGSAWRVVVLGSDGVRHAVTLAGADGAVTSNTVAGKGAGAAR